MTIVTGSFERALRGLFEDIPDEAIISVEIKGGGETQIGDMTWDTDPIEIEVDAYVPGNDAQLEALDLPPGWRHRWQHNTRRFDSLPELWAALHPEENS